MKESDFIMAHEKVFGFCENLCSVQVVPKEYFEIIEGAVTVEAPESGRTLGVLDKFIDYPEGFTPDNTFILSAMCYFTESNDGYSTGFHLGGDVPETSLYTKTVMTSDVPSVKLMDEQIRARFYNNKKVSCGYNYKILLMRIG